MQYQVQNKQQFKIHSIKNMRKLFFAITVAALSFSATVSSQTKVSKIAPLQNEKWWGGITGFGSNMPFASNTQQYDLNRQNMNNQTSPLMVSSKGRYIWSDMPYTFEINNDTIIINSKFEEVSAIQGGKTLREAYQTASQKHFPPTGRIPAEQFFSLPQYNTWIELMYDQNQEDIMNYADNILKNDFPTGVFMIDDNWQNYYGNYDFKADKFPDPKGMSEKLHADGFKVMLWVCPYVSPDSREFRDLNSKGYLVKQKGSNQPALIHWWNGISAFYDLTNPEVMDYLVGILKENQEKYGIDGFKFDGADVGYMKEGAYDFHDKSATNSDYTQKWAELGLHFPYNEYRATWKMGGTELVQRLGDKAYSWGAVKQLIPEMITAGLLGHLYLCPDMIGGGQFSNFLNIDAKSFNQELIVRSAQVHALMPMMQFSVAPWRILDKEHLDAARKAARLHESMSDYILECAHQASKDGEPIVRSMEYMYPDNGYEEIKDQFLLGDKYLVAPMLESGTKRSVILPKGRWKDDLGKTLKGGRTISIDVPIDRLPYFEKVGK